MTMESAFEKDLHDLCQPLTTLQCRLEYAQMLDDEVSLREAVEGGLMECQRMMASIEVMRSRLIEQGTSSGRRR
jgi:hypothetical protein